MSYAILRTAKLKSFGEIGGSLAHTFRTRDTPNADPLRLGDNEHHGPISDDEIKAAIKTLLPDKRRSDAVLCIEYFIGASPEFFAEGGDDAGYFGAAREWLLQRHGADNVVSTHVHRDETSPHLIAYVVPRDGEKLNAKKWLGGRAVLSAMQTDFAQTVGLRYGLERGEEGSVARHQTIKEYYAHVQAAERTIPKVEFPSERLVLEQKLFSETVETDADFARRVADATLKSVEPLIKRGLEAGQIAKRERAQAKKVGALTKALKVAQDRIGILEAPFEGLSPDDKDLLTRMLASTARRMREAARVITGWFRGITQPRLGEDHLIEIEERGTGVIHQIPSSVAAIDLVNSNVQPGDLIEVCSTSARIIDRSHDRER